ncbi:hypothetical protein [Rahnella woolbedingensis]|uniref:Uncharacterized protein n=1 Tax=Rahnella woolbedingensis TaxID=1510574 RepID=A0A419N854_9GAMM|nr:hypothetical protein [Rahnella woolbedingensis]RJT43514.1 hypothetical protein D6C13_13065 [Rahnella woolbedingensis]
MINLTTGVAPLLAEQYADMLSLDYRRRSGLLHSYHHNTDDLIKWDKRLHTYISGLLYLKNEAASYFETQLDSPLSRGDVFAMGVFAFHSGNIQLLEGCLGLMQAIPHLLSVINPLIAWAPVKSSLWELTFTNPLFRVISTYQKNGLPQAPALTDIEISKLEDLPVAIPGLIYALHQQRDPDYFSLVERLLNSPDVQISLEAIQTLLVRNLPYQGISIEALLFRLIQCNNDNIRERAVQLYLLNTGYSPTRCIDILSQKSSDKRLYLSALGISGMPENIPILSEYLESPDYARLSAASIVMITGKSPEQAGWNKLSPLPVYSSHLTQDDTIPENEDDENLSWADKSAFDQWWEENSCNFEKSYFYTGGYPATVAGQQSVLQRGLLALHPLAIARLQYLKQEVSTLPMPSFLHIS